jgi:hypothetical protein
MQINKRQLKKWIAALDRKKVDRRSRIGFLEFDWPVKYEVTWLINTDFGRKTSFAPSYLYNYCDYTFPEIATLLELVYIHKILD